MAILADILEWSTNRLLWQRDALRRLVQNGILTELDIQELTNILKISKGISVSQEIPQPKPLVAEHLPTSDETEDPVSLRAIQDVYGVNALAPEQRVSFSPVGMTLIYGDNGSGKSGYARIIRSACRARSPSARILPNVFDITSAGGACATLEYEVGATLKTTAWRDGNEPPPELHFISFFNSQCAPIYVDESNELAFTPRGLDILPKLASVCRTIQARLREEREQHTLLKPSSLRQLSAEPGTEARQAVESLDARSTMERFRRLARLTDRDRERIQELRRILAGNPLAVARELQLRHDRITYLRRLIEETELALSDEQLAGLQRKLRKMILLERSARTAAAQAFSDQPLESVGSDVWRELWESARRYSELEAYRGKEFPVTEEEARCVLCQQLLDRGATERLVRFETFICNDAQQQATESRTAFSSTFRSYEHMAISGRSYREALRDLELESKEDYKSARCFLASAHHRCRAIVRFCRARSWESAPELSEARTNELEMLCQKISQRIEELKKSAQSGERTRLEQELKELEARSWLGTVLDDVKEEILRLKRIAALDSAISETITTQITLRSSQLTDQYVTDVLLKRFADEVKTLGAGRRSINLVPAGGQYGQKLFRVQLRGLQQEVSTTAVLSEGEFQCVALAAFLAELSTTSSRSGIVLDDPVSSLDHNWRRKAAERLVEEAKGRQVVIFTHDVVFLLQLVGLCSEKGVALRQCQLLVNHRGAGLCMDGVPWIAMPVKRRISFLNDQLQQATAVFNKDGESKYEPLARHIYGLLREAWERAIEEVLLYQVVERFGYVVQTNRLRALSDITDDDIRTIEQGMSKASRCHTGHDEAAAINEPVPRPEELKMDIDVLERWVKDLRLRRR